MALQHEEFVVFVLAGQEYGIDITRVQEIIRIPKKTVKLPETMDYFLGVANLRDHVIPVIDLKRKLLGDYSEFLDETRVLVIELDGKKVGFIVDEVEEVLKISSHMIMPASDVTTAIQTEYLLGIANFDNRLLLLLDGNKLLQPKEMN